VHKMQIKYANHIW